MIGPLAAAQVVLVFPFVVGAVGPVKGPDAVLEVVAPLALVAAAGAEQRHPPAVGLPVADLPHVVYLVALPAGEGEVIPFAAAPDTALQIADLRLGFLQGEDQAVVLARIRVLQRRRPYGLGGGQIHRSADHGRPAAGADLQRIQQATHLQQLPGVVLPGDHGAPDTGHRVGCGQPLVGVQRPPVIAGVEKGVRPQQLPVPGQAGPFGGEGSGALRGQGAGRRAAVAEVHRQGHGR